MALDVGGVLSRKQDQKPDNTEIWKAAEENAYMFVHMLKHRTGDYPIIVSRVNHPSPRHWVVRFCESLGIPARQGASGQGCRR